MRADPAPARYDTVARQAMFEGEDRPGNRVWPGTHVHYLSDAERAAYRLDIADGVIRDAQGRRFDTAQGHTHWSGAGWAIFVMDASGTLYASLQHVVGRFHHSSLGQGRPVAGAGELKVREGTLVALTDHSSHYCPPRCCTDQVLHALRAQGVQTDALAVHLRY